MAKATNCGCPPVVQVTVPESSCVEIRGIPDASETVTPGGSTAALTDKQKINKLMSDVTCLKKKVAESEVRILALENKFKFWFTPNSTGEQFFVSGIVDAAIPRVAIIP